MKKPKEARILWLVDKSDNRTIVVGFLRDHSDGCFIIGGPTGSHYTGHGERWESKWENYISEGYIDADSAKKNKILSFDWNPPRIKKKDKIIIDKILKGIL